MATSLKELIVTYEANAKPVIDALNQIDNKIKMSAKSLESFGQSIKNAGQTLTASLTAPIAALGFGALKSAADFEALRMQMEVLTGSAAEGERVFNRLVKFAAETPFELKELSKATNTLMGFGESADDAYNHLRLIGDIAAVSGGDFQGIAVAFGQVSAAGRLMGQDLLQLVNNGVPVIKMLSDEMGVPKEQIKDLVSQGQVSFPILVRAFQRATMEGGMFYDGMNKLSKTAKGVWSTFKDNVNIALAKFGEELQTAFALTSKLEKFGAWIGRLADNFARLAPETKKNIFLILGLAAVIGPLLIVLGTMVRLFALAAAGFRLIIAPITFLIGLIPTLAAVIRAMMLVFAANPLTAFLAATISILYYWKEIVNFFKMAYEWITKISVSKIWEGIKDFAVNITGNGSASDRAKNAVSSPANQSTVNNQTKVQNNLVVNIPAGMSAADSNSLKAAIREAIQQENRQSYMEAATI